MMMTTDVKELTLTAAADAIRQALGALATGSVPPNYDDEMGIGRDAEDGEAAAERRARLGITHFGDAEEAGIRMRRPDLYPELQPKENFEVMCEGLYGEARAADAAKQPALAETLRKLVFILKDLRQCGADAAAHGDDRVRNITRDSFSLLKNLG
jgi:hypothetical protein